MRTVVIGSIELPLNSNFSELDRHFNVTAVAAAATHTQKLK